MEPEPEFGRLPMFPLQSAFLPGEDLRVIIDAEEGEGTVAAMVEIVWTGVGDRGGWGCGVRLPRFVSGEVTGAGGAGRAGVPEAGRRSGPLPRARRERLPAVRAGELRQPRPLTHPPRRESG